MKFSIIVPVYNVEKYLDECMSSLITQNYDSYEIILVDDGSTDASGKICDIWKGKSSKIKVIHKQNGGLSSARNTGLENALGEYIIFVDSDDYIEKDSLSKINACIKSDTDIVITRLIHVYPDSKEIRNSSITTLRDAGYEDCVRWIFEKSENCWPAPQYIIRKQYAVLHKLRFKEGFLHEDLDWTSRLFMQPSSISVCEYPWYYHRLQRPGSITTKGNAKRVADVYTMAAQLMEDLSDIDLEEWKISVISERIASSLFSILVQYTKCDSADRRMIVNCVKENRRILETSKNKKIACFRVLYNVFGYKFAIAVLSEGQKLARLIR